jgi:Tfp pilus assembly protein PilV
MTQRGMTLIGMLLSIIAMIIVVIFVMRVVPVYIQNYTINHVIRSLNNTPSSLMTGNMLSDTEIMKSELAKRLDINSVYDFNAEQVEFTPIETNKYTARYKYQVIRPLMYNISLLFNFDDTIEVTPGSEH